MLAGGVQGEGDGGRAAQDRDGGGQHGGAQQLGSYAGLVRRAGPLGRRGPARRVLAAGVGGGVRPGGVTAVPPALAAVRPRCGCAEM